MPPKPELRRLFKQQQKERQKEKKVEHPLAKYDSQDRLMCIVCNMVVKTTALWPVHLASSAHKETIARLKALKEQKSGATIKNNVPLKRTTVEDASNVTQHLEPASKRSRQDVENESGTDSYDDMEDNNQLPADFFDSEPRVSEPSQAQLERPQPAPSTTDSSIANLPTGFFDNPEEEARVRHEPSVEKQKEAQLEAAYAEFEQIMAETTEEAEKIVEEDDRELWLDRDEHLFQQQAEFDSRVEYLKSLRKKGVTAAEKESKSSSDLRDVIFDDKEQEVRAGLKSSVRSLLKQKQPKSVKTVFDDMDEDEDEDEDEDWEWRAQQL